MERTICALSTPPGRGGIAVIRLSGPDAFKIEEALLKRPDDSKNTSAGLLSKRESHKALLRKIYDPQTGMLLDEALLLPMKAPHTFTGEDTVETYCHGGMYLCRRILEALIYAGASMAQPGEFSRRAFLNGKIDLTQAEGIIDLIDASTDYSLQAASSGFQGKLYQAAENLRSELMEMLLKIEVGIDYPEYDDLPEITDDEIFSDVEKNLATIDDLLSTADEGILLKEGLKIAIIGKPNVGKSSLLNQLLKEDRAIVTDIPGTTRDVVSETADLGGVLVRLLDTAGIRSSDDIVEQFGVERSLKAAEDADLLLVMADAAGEMDFSFLNKELSKPYILLLNKTDLMDDAQKDAVLLQASDQAFGRKALAVLLISAKNGFGIEQITNLIKENFFSGALSNLQGPMVTNLRQKEALLRAKDALKRVLMGKGFSQDLLSIDLQDAAQALGDLTGKSTRDDLIDLIFSRFCLGK